MTFRSIILTLGSIFWVIFCSKPVMLQILPFHPVFINITETRLNAFSHIQTQINKPYYHFTIISSEKHYNIINPLMMVVGWGEHCGEVTQFVVPEAACWSEWAPLLSSLTTSPKLSSSVCILLLLLCYAPETSAAVHPGPRPPLAGAAHHWEAETAASVWAASAVSQVTSEIFANRQHHLFDEIVSVCYHSASHHTTCLLSLLRHPQASRL